MKSALLPIAFLVLAGLGLAACTTTPEERGPFHEYLHEHGLE